MTSLDALPRALGPYALLVPLGQGGMGTVVIGAPLDERDRLCLLKLLKPGLVRQHDYLPRFVDEAKVAVALVHENLCRVFDAGEVGGELYLAMELIEGVTFKRLLEIVADQGRALRPEEAVALAAGMLRGLQGAHTATVPGTDIALHVVHRDVSPHNAMIDVHGRVKVIDFGLATSVLKATVTESAVVLGKSGYMAPEQARGDDVGVTVDAYAAAIVLYELLVGDRYYGDLPSRAVWTLAGSGNHRPRAWDRVPVELEPILRRALAPRPEDRFPSCADFADALERAVPQARDPAVRVRLGELVRDAYPDELRAIDEARHLLARLPPGALEASRDVTQSTRIQAQPRTETGAYTATELRPRRQPKQDQNTESTRLVGAHRRLERQEAAPETPRQRLRAAVTRNAAASVGGVVALALALAIVAANAGRDEDPRAAQPAKESPSASTTSPPPSPPSDPPAAVEATPPPPPPDLQPGGDTAPSEQVSETRPARMVDKPRREPARSPIREPRRPEPDPEELVTLLNQRIARVLDAALSAPAGSNCRVCEQTMKSLMKRADTPASRLRARTRVAQCETLCGLP